MSSQTPETRNTSQQQVVNQQRIITSETKHTYQRKGYLAEETGLMKFF